MTEYHKIDDERSRQALLQLVWYRGSGSESKSWGEYKELQALLVNEVGRYAAECVQCGTWFVAQNRKKRTCSKFCSHRRWRGWKLNERACVVCGVGIVSVWRNKRYCSSNCRVQACKARKAFARLESGELG